MKTIKSTYLFLLVLTITLSILPISCLEKKTMKPEELKMWYIGNKSDFVLNHSTKDYDYNLIIVPNEIVAINASDSLNQIKDILQDNKGFLHGYLEIIPKGDVSFLGKNVLSKGFNQRLHYFTSGVQEDIFMKQCGQTFYLQNFHLERYYNHAPDRLNIILENDIDCKKDQIIHFNADIFNEGLVKFKLKQTLFEGMPQLIL